MNKKQQALYESKTNKQSNVKKFSNKNQKKPISKKKTNTNLFALIAISSVILIGAVLFILLNSGSSTSSTNTPPATVGILPKLDPSKYAGSANDFTLTDTEGKKHTLSDNGGRLVLLDFTASWCKWCKEQSPDLHKLYEKYGKKVQFYAIDVNEPLQTVINYRNEDGAIWPYLVDSNGKIAAMYQVEGYPYYLLLNKDGTILKPQSGYSPSFFEDFSTVIDQNID